MSEAWDLRELVHGVERENDVYPKRLVAAAITIACQCSLLGLANADAYTPVRGWMIDWGARSVAFDRYSRVYVAGGYVVEKFAVNGELLTSWGSRGSGSGQLRETCSIAVDDGGNVFVADAGNARIQRFTFYGAYVAQWACSGWPLDIDVDSRGNVYLPVGFSIEKFDATGNLLAEWHAPDGCPECSQMVALAVDPRGYIYAVKALTTLVPDAYGRDSAVYAGSRIQKFDTNGNFLLEWGSLGSGPGQLESPWGIGVDDDGYVYVADTNNSRIQKFDPNGSFITAWGTWGTGAGEFRWPTDVAVSPAGEVFVVDRGNARMQVFAPAGVTSATRPTWGGLKAAYR